VVVLALALRLLPAPAGAATADAWGGIPICHADPTGAEPAGSPAGKQDKTAHDCVLCPVCLTTAPPHPGRHRTAGPAANRRPAARATRLIHRPMLVPLAGA
jgi:hypothetical protein